MAIQQGPFPAPKKGCAQQSNDLNGALRSAMNHVFLAEGTNFAAGGSGKLHENTTRWGQAARHKEGRG